MEEHREKETGNSPMPGSVSMMSFSRFTRDPKTASFSPSKLLIAKSQGR
jgi:hypothetical protein